MDCQRFRHVLLLTALTGWCGCSSSATEQSYELVEAPAAETPLAAPAAESAPAPSTPAQEQAVAAPTVADDTQLNDPPGKPPEAKAADVKQAFVETPAQPAAVQIAAMRRDAVDPGSAAAALDPLKPAPEALKNLAPNKIELKVPHKQFDREGREKALRISYDDLDLLKVLNMEPVPLNAEEYLPDWLKSLNGEKVRLRGWMFPPLMTEGLPAFLFVRDNQICCFGREAKVYDKVRVTMKEGTTTDYIFGRPFDVIGTFHIASEERDGELYFLYSIDDAVVMK